MLDDIPGIGEKRKLDLLRRFGSVKKIKEADMSVLEAVVGPKTARRVYDHLADS